MYKQTEKIKKELIEFTDAINAFRSEAVQVIVAYRILEHLNPSDNIYADSKNKELTQTGEKKIGATMILRHLVGNDFFDTPQSLAATTEFCAEKYDMTLYTTQVSGILLSLVKVNKLSRLKSDKTNRYVYLKSVG
jgi:hypothetical protein